MNVRIAAVAAVSAALVATGATAAVAAPAAPRPTITINTSRAAVKLHNTVTFTGKTRGLREGSKVTLQVKDGARWLSLPHTAKVTDAAYKLNDKFERKGVKVLRVKDGATVSKAVSVTVR